MIQIFFRAFLGFRGAGLVGRPISILYSLSRPMTWCDFSNVGWCEFIVQRFLHAKKNTEAWAYRSGNGHSLIPTNDFWGWSTSSHELIWCKFHRKTDKCPNGHFWACLKLGDASIISNVWAWNVENEGFKPLTLGFPNAKLHILEHVQLCLTTKSDHLCVPLILHVVLPC